MLHPVFIGFAEIDKFAELCLSDGWWCSSMLHTFSMYFTKTRQLAQLCRACSFLRPAQPNMLYSLSMHVSKFVHIAQDAYPDRG